MISSPTNLNQQSLNPWGVLIQHIFASNFDYQVSTGSLKRTRVWNVLSQCRHLWDSFGCSYDLPRTPQNHEEKHRQRRPIIYMRQKQRGLTCKYLYLSIYIHIYRYNYIYIYISTYIYTYIYIYIYTYIYIYIYIYTDTYIYIIHRNTHTYIYIYIIHYIYTYLCIYIYIYTHVYIYIFILSVRLRVRLVSAFPRHGAVPVSSV